MEGLREGREGVGNEGVVVVVLYMKGLQRERDGEGGGRDTGAGAVVLYKGKQGGRGTERVVVLLHEGLQGGKDEG